MEGLSKMTALNTLNLLYEPYGNWHGNHSYPSAMVFEDSYDVQIGGLGPGKTPSTIVEQVCSNMDRFRSLHLPQWQPPTVEFSILCPRHFKRSGFCAVPQRCQSPDTIPSQEAVVDEEGMQINAARDWRWWR
jgi:hypothetical protein